MQELVRRHQVLRMAFPDIDGQPVAQLIEDVATELPITDALASAEEERDHELDRVLRDEYKIPFDLRRGPVFRTRLVRFADDAHCLLVMIHHIAADGWSSGVLFSDLCAIYAAYAEGDSSTLAEPVLQYADFAAWQRQRLQPAKMEKQLAYWTEALQNAPVLDIPKDGQQGIKTFRAISLERHLSPELSRALRELSRAQGVTLFVTMMAAFMVLMHRYSGQDDIVIGTPYTTRNRPELESMVGLLVNMVALRIDLEGNPSFRECLRRAWEVMRDVSDHSEVPFPKVVSAVQPERVVGRNPIVQVAFSPDMGNQALLSNRQQLAGLTISPVQKDDILTHIEMEAYMRDSGEDVSILMVCAEECFAPESVDRYLDHFLRVLESVAFAPDQLINEISLFDAEERTRLLQQGEGPGREFRHDQAIHELFEDWVARDAGAEAIEFDGETLSYGELNTRANRLARHLQKQGVGQETLVGVCLDRGVDLIVSMLAIFKAGAAYLPLDPKYPAARLRYMIEDASLPVIVSRDELVDLLAEFEVRVDTDSAQIDAEAADNLGRQASAESLAYVIYTSGSTGRPKGTLLEHIGLCKVSAEQEHWFGAGPGSRVLQFSSPNFDASLFDITMALTTGATLVLARQEALQPGPPLAAVLRDRRISILTIPPSSLGVLVPESLPDLKVINVAGEACPASLVDRWAPGRRLFNLYGPTECTIWSTAQECVAGSGPPTIGRPIANTRIYVLDRHGQPTPVGVPGEMCIGGVGVARGYLNLEEMTRQRFVDDPLPGGSGRMYRTGDKARYLADGTLEFIGRMDQQVKVRGFRIELGEIEAVLGQTAGVEAAVVVARDDSAGDRRLVAYVVPGGARQATVDGLRSALQDQLPVHMVPANFVLLERLPLTPNGKVDQQALPDPEGERQLEREAVPPRDDLERELVAIWLALLDIDEVGVEDNFFDVGGHSLLLVQVQERIRQLIEVDLPMVALFEYPTIRALAMHIRGGAPAADSGLLEAMRSRQRPSGQREPIAVIGMAGRFPGAATLDAFWARLCAGEELIRFFDTEELQAAGVDDRLLAQSNFVPAKGFLEDGDLFDAQFFGYSPREADLLDPQHRVFMELAWQALEDAGYGTGGGDVGVFAGSSENTYWFSILRNDSLAEAGMLEHGLAAGKDFLATRVAYKLDLRGPAITVQTACSTSLVAVHEACKSLLSGECSMALAGGVSVNVPLKNGYLYEENSIASPDGHCRAFDANAQGTVGGDGAGIVVLKRLSEAVRDGDPIHAVIRGSAINNDGANKVGYTAPAVEGQAEAIAGALLAAEVPPESISYIESHGTGTSLGDPIEITALKRVFGESADSQRIAIGALKANIGHLDAAAGVASLIKTVLAARHGVLPPTPHFEQPNPDLKLEGSPFFVNAELLDWRVDDAPRRAGVSSFGIGGTNVHVVVEEPPAPVNETRNDAGRQLLLMSARSETALGTMAANLAARLEREPGIDLGDVAYTLQVGRRRFRHYRALVCDNAAEAVAALRDEGIGVTGRSSDVDGRQVVFMFPGQGSQYVDMGRDLYDSLPLFRELVDECCSKLEPELGLDLRSVLFSTAGQSPASTPGLTSTDIVQPALFVVEYALARQLMAWGIRPAAMIGHSLGEYVAACVAGVISLDDALPLVAVRARLMGQMVPGKMLAVPLAADVLQRRLDEQLSIAALNGPELTVVSGPEDAVERLRKALEREDVEARVLHTSHAFHSASMEPVLEPLAEHLAGIELRAPQIPYLSNLTGNWITAEQATAADYYLQHLRQSVRFADGLENLFEHGDWLLLEVGPGKVLSGLARAHPARAADQPLVGSMRHPEQNCDDQRLLLETLASLWAAGVEVDWPAVHDDRSPRRVALPGYPFERQRYWIEAQRHAGPSAGNSLGKRPDPANWFYLPSWKRGEPLSTLQQAKAARWLVIADGDRLDAELAAAMPDSATVVHARPAERFARRGRDDFDIVPDDPESYRQLIAQLQAEERLPEAILHLLLTSSPNPGEAQSLELHQARGLYSLTFLAQALADVVDHSSHWVVATNGLHDVLGNETLEPGKATVLGPCRVLPAENPQIHCRLVDLERGPKGGPVSEQLRALIGEFGRNAAEPVVAYRGRHRWVQTAEPVQLESPVADAGALREQGCYLITGGLGGMGLELAAHLARKVRARLVLVGRTGLPQRVAWPGYLEGADDCDPVADRIRRIQAMEAAGAEVLVCAADVANDEEMARAVVEAEQQFGEIHGVVHAAGVPGGGVLERQTRSSLETVMAPKVIGTRILDKLFRDRQLDFLLLCSSLTSFVGIPGRGDYVAANAFMDAYARAEAQRGRSDIFTVNWDTWIEAGMAVGHAGPPAAGLSGEDGGMTNAEAVQVFQYLAANRYPQLLVSVRDFQPAMLERMALDANGTAEATGGEAVESIPSQSHPRPNLETTYEPPGTEVERLLVEIWQQQLGIEPVGIEDNFFELGGDSVLAIHIVGKANQAGYKIKPNQLFEHQTIRELAEVASVSGSDPGPAQEISGELPLTPVQHWFFDLELPDPNHFNQSIMLAVPEGLNVAAFERSLARVVEHHDALRSRYTRNLASWRQHIEAPGETVPVERIDLLGMEPGLQRRRIEERAGELQTSLKLDTGPLLRAALFELGGERGGRIVLVAHHLVVDAVSWGVLVEDLWTGYERAVAGADTIELPGKTTSVKEWSQRLVDYAATSVAEEEMAFWREQANKTVNPLPVDLEGGANSAASTATVTTELSEEQTHALITEANRALDTQVEDLLLTALWRAFHEWTSQSCLAVMQEGHGRSGLLQDLDVSRTTGWFTSLYPLYLEAPEATALEDLIVTIRDQRHALPNRGMGFGVLRYLSPDAGIRNALALLPDPEVVFLYLGQFDRNLSLPGGWSRADEPLGPQRSASSDRAHLFEITAMIQQGRLQVHWHYSSNLHRAATVEHLAQAFIGSLGALIDFGLEADTEPDESPALTAANLALSDLEKIKQRLAGRQKS